MATSADLLRALDVAIKAANGQLFRTLAVPAEEAALGDLKTALGALPDELRDWFTWHNGSDDGFWPDSSLRMMSLDEVLSELEFLEENPPDGLDGATRLCPLLMDGGGGFATYAQDAALRPVVLTYERGQITASTPWEDWLGGLLASWVGARDVQ